MDAQADGHEPVIKVQLNRRNQNSMGEGLAKSPIKLASILQMLRPKQWAKNLLVLAGILFGERAISMGAIGDVIIGFFAFSIACSAVYIINDIFDAPSDRLHPTKRFRPIASGTVSTSLAVAIAVVLLAVSIVASTLLSLWALYILLCYLGIQVLYNLYLKSEAIADVFTIAIGFILRAIYGSAIVHVDVSSWLIYCTGALALTLAFGKRRAELISSQSSQVVARKSLTKYSKEALDALFIMFATASGIAYGIYSVESHSAQKHPALLLTSPFVFYGIARYVLIVFGQSEGEEPAELLLKDGHILFSVLGFMIAAVLSVKWIALPHLLH